MTKPGKQPAKKPAAESDAPKATIDKGAKGGLEALFAEMSKTCAPGKSTGGPKSKPRTELPYSLNWTVHASSGQQGKNLLLKYTIFAWEKDSLTGLLGGLPCDAMWYDKDSKTNMAKVPTPEVAEILVAKVKAACSESGPKMIGELSAPDGYEAPEITIVKVDSLTIDDEETDKPFIFMVGQMFLLKDVLKAKFGFRYHEIQFRNSPRCAAWHVEITDLTEDGVKELLESFGYKVKVQDLRSEDE